MKFFCGLGHAKLDVMVTELETYLRVGYKDDKSMKYTKIAIQLANARV